MNSHDKIINIALAFDQNFLVPFYVLLTSIFENNTTEQIAIYAIATGISDEQKQEVIEFVQNHNSTIQFYQIDREYVASFANNPDVRYGLAAFYRLLLPGLLPREVSKFIYMDVDVIVVGGVRELYQTDISNVPVAAVPDPVEWDRPDLGIDNRADYFNSGVLLINTLLWKKQQISEKAIEFLKQYPEKATYVDQDALNAVLLNNWVKLEEKFNFTYRVVPFDSKKNLKEFIKGKTIIHYNESAKPWHRISGNKLNFLYHEYFRKSPKATLNPYQPFIFSKQNVQKIAKVKLDYLYFNFPLFTYLWRKIK